MAVDPSDRQGVMRTSRVEEAPNPGPWPQATPVAEVSQPDGDNSSTSMTMSNGCIREVRFLPLIFWYWPLRR